MILYEDYFDKIELTDDVFDRTGNDDVIENIETIYRHGQNYEQTIEIRIDNNYLSKFPEKATDLPNICNKVIGQLKFVFEYYNVEYSDFYLVYNSCKSQRYRKHTKERLITHYDNFISIDPDDDVSFETSDCVASIFVYVNYPKKMSIKHACSFIFNIHNILWVNHPSTYEYFMYIDLNSAINIFERNTDDEGDALFHRVYSYDKFTIKSTISNNNFTNWFIANKTVRWFFDENTYQKFKYEEDSGHNPFEII